MPNSRNVSLLVVPLHEEMKYIDAALLNCGFVHTRVFDPNAWSHEYVGQRMDRTTIRIRCIVLDRDHREVMGNVSTAALVPALLGTYRPQVAVLVGLAGSVKHDTVHLGDVIISNIAKLYYPDKLRKLDQQKDMVVDTVPIADIRGFRQQHKDSRIVDPLKLFATDSYFRFRRDVATSNSSDGIIDDYVLHCQRHPLNRLKPVDDAALGKLKPEVKDVCRNLNPRLLSGAIMGSDWVVDSESYIKFVLHRDKVLAGEEMHAADIYSQSDSDRLTSFAQSPTGQVPVLPGKKRNRWSPQPLLAVDMETFGFLKAVDSFQKAVAPQLLAASIRGISDLASMKSELDEASADEVRKIAVENAAEVAVDYIRRIDTYNVALRH